MLSLNKELEKKINNLWNKFWSGGIANPITAIEQITYLIFIRRLDEMDREKVEAAKYTGEKYSSIFKGTFLPNGMKEERTINRKELRWSEFKKNTDPEYVLNHVREYVFPFIKEKLAEAEEPFARHMRDAVFIIPKPTLLEEAIKEIDAIYTEIDREVKEEGVNFQDTLGDVYEHLLNAIATSGKNGQFRTPRHIIRMVCEVVNPRLGDRICDPTCGTGGFLLGAYLHILTSFSSSTKPDGDGFLTSTVADRLTSSRDRKRLREETFFGFDFDTTMVRLGLMNLMLHGITRPNIDYQDTLSKKFTQNDYYDVVLANPPFKGSIDAQDVDDKLQLKSTKTELLFVNRIINMLRIGGKAGVIIPDGVLFGSSKAHQSLRKMLLYRCQLEAVISMPSGVFKPYAGVSTAVLIFSKASNEMNIRHTDKVWFYNLESDGRSLDDKRTRLSHNGDLQDMPARYLSKNADAETDRRKKYFFVSADQIEENGFDLSLNRYREQVYEELNYEPPKELLSKLLEYEEKIKAGLEELNRLIK